jgi:rubrerythrin
MMGKEHSTGTRIGTRDELYDLISVLYHTLQGAETYLQYIEDAEQTGDNELAQFFREIQQQDRQRADRAKELLRQRINQSKSH